MKSLITLLLMLLMTTVTLAANNLTAVPTTLVFTNVTVSPSASKSYVLTNTGTLSIPMLVTVTPSAHTQVSLDNATFYSTAKTVAINSQKTATVWVRVVTAAPITVTEIVTNTGGGTNTAPVTIGIDAPLPIQLASFSASAISGSGVTLTWMTVSEVNNFGFYVQRDGQDIAFIAGNGTTIQHHTYSYTDNTVAGEHKYRLKQVDLDGTFTLSDEITATIPSEYVLNQNYPNPFNPTTTISFRLTKGGPANLSVYNVVGERVATLVDETRAAGDQSVRWDATNFSSGTYIYVLRADNKVSIKTMVLLK